MWIHHLNITCKNINTAKSKFLSLYGFACYGKIQNAYLQCYVLKQNHMYVTLTENEKTLVDTIDDIAFSVDSVHEYCSRDEKSIVQGPVVLDCKGNLISDNGDNLCDCHTSPCQNYIEVAKIKSPVGNLYHTILNKRNFCGEFFPSFVRNMEITSSVESTLDFIDHIALAVPCGNSLSCMKWYESNLKMFHFKTTLKESSNGIVIRAPHGNGIQILTLTGHPCSDNSISSKPQELELSGDSIKLVFCESLIDKGSDQIQSFLRTHGGAGVQHVAFHTSQILNQAHRWHCSGVTFIKPPNAYYNEIRSTLHKLRSKLDVNDVHDLGILIDAEKRVVEDKTEQEGYLYQVFTKPILESGTFFFELIQRDKARGFGAGNVSALWRALDEHLRAPSNNSY